MQTDLAVNCYKMCTVPFYSTYQPEVIEHICEITSLTTIFTSAECLKKILECKKGTLKTIVSFDN